MSRKVDLFDSTYAHFEAEVLARVRGKTFGVVHRLTSERRLTTRRSPPPGPRRITGRS